MEKTWKNMESSGTSWKRMENHGTSWTLIIQWFNGLGVDLMTPIANLITFQKCQITAFQKRP